MKGSGMGVKQIVLPFSPNGKPFFRFPPRTADSSLYPEGGGIRTEGLLSRTLLIFGLGIRKDFPNGIIP